MVTLPEESDELEKGNKDAHFLKRDQLKVIGESKIDRYRQAIKGKNKPANK